MLRVEIRIKMKLLRKLLPWYVFFFGSLVLIAVLYGLLAGSMVGVIFLFFAFVSLRYEYKDRLTYHADSTRKCILLSILIFALASIYLIIFNTRISFLASVPIAIGITWILYSLGERDKLRVEVSSLRAPKVFDLDDCTEEELRVRCKERFTRDVEYKTERAIKHFVLKLPHEEIDINPEQSKKERYRFRKILK